MSFLLKIVQGPNAGAEIALAEGVTLSVGSADTCDIVFSDAAVEPLAFELEVTEERVMAILPGGKTIKLDPYHVTLVGTTALAVGPLEGAWKELVWPKREVIAQDETAEQAEEATVLAVEESDEEKPTRSFGWLWFLLVLLLLIGAGVFCWWKYPEQSKSYAQTGWAYAQTGWAWVRDTTGTYYRKVVEPPPPPPPAATLDEVAADCGFTLAEKNGKPVAFGNFATRAERLQATARAYAAQPGVSVDFADEESLKSAVDELLLLVTEEKIQAVKVEGRKLFLAGEVSTQMELRKILESVSADVPKIAETDCADVTITGLTVASEPADDGTRFRVPRLPAERSTVRNTDGVMPIVGILTVPYPCLVLENGTRAMEGARFGEYTIEKIGADSVTVRGSDGTFVWRP